MSAIKKTLSRSNGSSNQANSKPSKPKPLAQNGRDSTPDDRSAAAAAAKGGFDSPWLGALPHRWRAQRPE
jgi:hypothetical protein